MNCQVEKSEHLWHVLCLRLTVSRENAVRENTSRKWFNNFKQCWFDLIDCLFRKTIILETIWMVDLWWFKICQPSCDIYTPWGRFKNWNLDIVCFKQKQQKSAEIHCDFLLSHYWVTYDQHQSFLFRIFIGEEKLCLYGKMRKKEKCDPLQKGNSLCKSVCVYPQKTTISVYWHCVLGIASQKHNYHCSLLMFIALQLQFKKTFIKKTLSIVVRECTTILC